MITLATLATATEFDVFNQVKEHLLKQGRKSEREFSGACRYREGDLKCAAGCLISDEEYDPEWENIGWLSLVTSGRVPKEHEGLIYRLQLIHDNYTVDQWTTALRVIEDQLNYDEEGNKCRVK